MKNLLWIAVLVAGAYAYQAGYVDSFFNMGKSLPATTTNPQPGGPAVVRELQQRPNEISKMNQAMGSAPSGSVARGHADRARKALGGGNN